MSSRVVTLPNGLKLVVDPEGPWLLVDDVGHRRPERFATQGDAERYADARCLSTRWRATRSPPPEAPPGRKPRERAKSQRRSIVLEWLRGERGWVGAGDHPAMGASRVLAALFALRAQGYARSQRQPDGSLRWRAVGHSTAPKPAPEAAFGGGYRVKRGLRYLTAAGTWSTARRRARLYATREEAEEACKESSEGARRVGTRRAANGG